MDNEALALRIQNGEKELYSELWDNNRRFITRCAFAWYRKNPGVCDSAGVTVDDLIQCGFIALCEAVQVFKPEAGYRFITYITFPLKRLYQEATGIRTKKAVILNHCLSLDAPLTEDADSATLGDITPDEDSAAELRAADEKAYAASLHKALEQGLAQIPAEQAEVLRMKYFQGLSLEEICRSAGDTQANIRQLNSSAIRNMRKPAITKALLPFKEDYIEEKAYNGTGFHAWKDRGSVEERIAEKLL